MLAGDAARPGTPIGAPRVVNRSSAQRVLRTLVGTPLSIVGLVFIGGLVLLALLGPELAPHSPTQMALGARLQPPSAAHLFGSDELGRDIFSRVLHGARISLTVALVVVALASVVGGALGAVAGFVGGRLDELVMRVGDMFLAFPALVLAMAIVSVLGPGLQNAMLAVAVAWWPGYARLVRGLILSLKELAFVEAARVVGASGGRILVRHVLPNCIAPLTVKMTMDAGAAILTTASLSFIGLGVRPPTPEWGFMVANGRSYILDQWWYSTFPGLFIFVTVLGFSLLGDGLRDAMDPRLRR